MCNRLDGYTTRASSMRHTPFPKYIGYELICLSEGNEAEMLCSFRERLTSVDINIVLTSRT